MKLNSIAAMSLLALVAAVSLSGCSEKPLSNEEACQEIKKQANEQDVDMNSTGSLGDTVEQGKKISAIFHNVAKQAEPEISAEFEVFAEDTDAVIAVFTDDSLDLQQMQTKMSLLDTEETRARSENVGKLCPGLSDL